MRLPHGFEDLEDLAAAWSAPTRAERFARHLSSTGTEIAELYERLVPRLPAILEHIGSRPVDALSDEESLLLGLCLMIAEAGPGFEVTGRVGMDRTLLGRLHCDRW